MQQQRFFRLNAVQVSHKAGRTDTGNDLQNKEHKKQTFTKNGRKCASVCIHVHSHL